MKQSFIIIAAILILLISGAYFLTRDKTGDVPDTTEAEVYQSTQYGFAFTVPEGVSVHEYVPEAVSVGTPIGADGFESAADVHVYSAGEEVGYENFDEFVFETLTNMCAADGPNETIYCDAIENRQPFSAASGQEGEVLYLRRVHENFTTQQEEIDGFGPVFVFNIQANVPSMQFAMLAVQPPANLPASDVDSQTVRAIADSVVIERVDTADVWGETIDPESGVAFSYPEQLPTEYMQQVDWPPRVLALEGTYSCTEAGKATARAGGTDERTIGGSHYCVTVSSEGAAGSIYEQYAYVFQKDDRVLSLTFSLRLPQCGNYDSQQQQACENERTAFNIDELVHQIAQTIRL